MCVSVCVSHPDKNREERPAAVRQVDVGVQQVLVQQWVVKGTQTGQDGGQLQVQLVWLQTHDNMSPDTHTYTHTHLTHVSASHRIRLYTRGSGAGGGWWQWWVGPATDWNSTVGH